MKAEVFKFKQFSVYDNNSSMKVGTDAVLIGAWANTSFAKSILDIGTGCGVIALMMAQSSKANIDAIDIDESSISEAKRNVLNSSWPDKIKTIKTSLQDFVKNNDTKYDLIISNPPFFNNSHKPPDSKKKLAKHTDSLPFDVLILSIKKILNLNGSFCLILPYKEFQTFKDIIRIQGLFVNNITFVKPKKSKNTNRVLAEINFYENTEKKISRLCIRNENNSFTKEYIHLTKEFYPAF